MQRAKLRMVQTRCQVLERRLEVKGRQVAKLERGWRRGGGGEGAKRGGGAAGEEAAGG